MSHKPKILLVILTIPLLLLLGIAYAGELPEGEPLAIEFAMEKSFYVPASSASEKIKYVVIRVPADKQSEPRKVSAIRLEPRMEGNKVRVNVYALKGDADHIITCRDWEALEANLVGSYLAGLDETVQLLKLKDYGVGVGDEPLMYRVVPRRFLYPTPQEELIEGCGCGSCDGLICCPNPGYCVNCLPCGSFCCKT